MGAFFERFSDRRRYRLASVALLAGSALPFLAAIAKLSWGWTLLTFAVGAAFYIALVVLTYYRLRDARLSGWWLVPMVMAFNVGPKWDLGSSITFIRAA